MNESLKNLFLDIEPSFYIHMTWYRHAPHFNCASDKAEWQRSVWRGLASRDENWISAEISRMLANLGPSQREAVTAYYGIDGSKPIESYSEIARQRGVTHTAVNSAVQRALRNMGREFVSILELERDAEIKNSTPPKVLKGDAPIEKMDMSQQTYMLLRRSGIYTFKQLIDAQDSLAKIRGFGSTRLLEIKKLLEEYGTTQ